MRAFSSLVAAGWFAALLGLAQAAELADHRSLGFTPNGDTFAFEEFGVQDGSGFPFANIYVIDTATDSWVPGTPFRVLIEDEGVPLAQARHQARQAAAPLVGKIALEDRALVLASSPLGEFEADPVSLAFGVPLPSDALAEPTARYRARLEIFHAETPGIDCTGMIGEPANGFRLLIENLDTGNEAMLHEDRTIPASRGCPITYRLSEVVVPDAWPVETAVVLVSVIGLGFEGAGRRFLAVAGDLPD